ncbi:hypothetical protein GCK32_003559 [Trichostrongylus colubriformis]|uniref:Uncharacterized protein n=1 Tax=Trichostrongylus colubriformis TaxID=6319 RepID=A0AAN8G218_TRICO
MYNSVQLVVLVCLCHSASPPWPPWKLTDRLGPFDMDDGIRMQRYVIIKFTDKASYLSCKSPKFKYGYVDARRDRIKKALSKAGFTAMEKCIRGQLKNNPTQRPGKLTTVIARKFQPTKRPTTIKGLSTKSSIKAGLLSTAIQKSTITSHSGIVAAPRSTQAVRRVSTPASHQSNIHGKY